MVSSMIDANWVGMNSSAIEDLPFPRDFRSVPGASNGDTDASSFYLYSSTEDVQGDGAEKSFNFQNFTRTLEFQEAFDNQSTTTAPFQPFFGDDTTEYIFDRSDVRAIFLVLYTIVFCSCFFGNLMVILVVTLHWRMRSITNFCLANLAFADLCVGIFCVYQNIVTYMMESWVFGEFMCKMYHFINSLSTTASVLILVVICIERYLAIIHPMTCKQMLTLNRLRITIVLVWILSAAISSPRFYYFSTLTMPLPNDQYEILCLPNRLKYDSKLMDMISMTVLFLIPLAIISILYTQIGIVLWKSSNTKMPAATPSVESSSSSGGYYRDTDAHIIQTVNLTLLPVSDQQLQHQQQQSNVANQHHHPHCVCAANRPNVLQGISTSCSPSPPCKTEKKGGKYSSLLPSPFVCLNCRNKSRAKSQRKCTKKHVCKASCRILNNGSVSASAATAAISSNSAGSRTCARNIPLDPPNSMNVPTVTPIAGVGTSESASVCRACQCPIGINGHVSGVPFETIETTQTTSFINSTCNHPQHGHPHNILGNTNGCCVTSSLENENGVCEGTSRNEATSSPVATTCCGASCANGRFRPKSICVRKQGSNEKTVTFSNASPPSPFCNRNCPCLEGQSSKTEPIVLVKFEKKKQSSKKKGRRNQQCTILMMNTNQCPSGNGCGNNRIERDSDECTDSPRTISPSPPRFDCGICHPQPSSAAQSEIVAGGESNITTRPIHNHSCHAKNFTFEHTRNISVDSGISGMPCTNGSTTNMTNSAARNIIEGSDQNFDGICSRVNPCPACGSTCGQLHHHYHHQCVPPQPSPKPMAGVSPQTTSQPKRLRRMRIVRSSKYGTGALQSRRRIIKMLCIVVLAFAVCHLPFHARKVWQYWSPKWAQYQAGSVFSTLFTPITFLIMYANSAINPLLYAFLSKKFRMSFKDLLCCKMRHSLRISRNASVRSTHAVQLSQTGL